MGTQLYSIHNKYYELKKLVGLLLQLEKLAVFIHKSGHDNVTMQPHTESKSTHSFTQAWEHRHRQTVHTFSFL